MQKREKILLAVVLVFGAVFVFGFGVNLYLFKPAAALERLQVARLAELQDLRERQGEAQRATHHMQQMARRTYADDPDRATAIAGERLLTLLQQAGLTPADFIRTPTAARRLRGGVEVGWSVRGRGALADVVDLLFLLDAEPVEHRVDALSLSAGDSAGHVNVQFRFVTLVLNAVPPGDREPIESRVALADEQRELYAGITTRDLFRPYIKRPPPPPPRDERRREPEREARREPAPPGPETYRVVSLTQWRGQAEVHVYDTTEQRTDRYVPGDELAGGPIVMVDYRTLPLPDNPALRSQSRVIVEIDSDYWAVERGHTLADKYQLDGDRLPAELRSRETGSVAGATSDDSDDRIR